MCLHELNLKGYVLVNFNSFNYKRVYFNLKSWKATAQYFREITYPFKVLFNEVVLKYISRILEILPWGLIGVTYQDVLIETTSWTISACYSVMYPDILEAEDTEWLFWEKMLKGWLMAH